MAHRTFIGRITVPKYIRRVKISKAQRPKYFEWNGTTIKCGSKKLWKKCIDPTYERDIILNNGNILPQYLKKDYIVLGFKGNTCTETIHSYPDSMVGITPEEIPKKDYNKPTKYFVCHYTRPYNKVIANPSQVSEPRYQIINGNYIYNHTASPFTTGKVFDAIKEMYYNKFRTIKNLNDFKNKLNSSYPLQIEVEIHDTVKNVFDNSKKGHGRIWDVGNRADPYMKTFLDFITNGYISGNLPEGLYDVEPLIEEDDRLHVSSGNNAYYYPVEHEEDRKLVFNFYKDENPLFNQYLNS